MTAETARWISQDKAHCWHPFTPQDAWCAPDYEPLVLTGGEGAWLIDSEGRRYLDGNSSIWTNIHGHRHPRLTAALKRQADQVAHTSYLGYANPLAGELAERLTTFFPVGSLERVFFSDDGSTAIECALKMTLQYRQQTGQSQRQGVIAFQNAYHGDTLGAASMSGVERFFQRFDSLGLPVTRVADMVELRALSEDVVKAMSAVIIEPLIQGVNQMTPWPQGMLAELREWCDDHDIHLILDEVMTGFGRTGTMFACQQEDVIPDFLCLAKGLTGGYLPLAATLTTAQIYDAFRGDAGNAFYYGHSYTANQMGCAVALASLDVFEEDAVLHSLQEKIEVFRNCLSELNHPVRQIGLIAGVDVSDGQAVCQRLREKGILTRPILNTVVLMPPLCISIEDLRMFIRALGEVAE